MGNVMAANVCLNVAHVAQLLIGRVQLEKRKQQDIHKNLDLQCTLDIQ